MLNALVRDLLNEVLNGVTGDVTLLVKVEVLEDVDVDVEAIVLVEDVHVCEVCVLDAVILLVKVDVTVVMSAI